jgi:hypothetical protein
MHAVVVRVAISDFEGGRTHLREQVVPRVSSAPGFVAAYWTRSGDSTNGLSMMVFDSEDNARAAADTVRAAPMPDAVSLEDVEVREVVESA